MMVWSQCEFWHIYVVCWCSLVVAVADCCHKFTNSTGLPKAMQCAWMHICVIVYNIVRWFLVFVFDVCLDISWFVQFASVSFLPLSVISASTGPVLLSLHGGVVIKQLSCLCLILLGLVMCIQICLIGCHLCVIMLIFKDLCFASSWNIFIIYQSTSISVLTLFIKNCHISSTLYNRWVIQDHHGDLIIWNFHFSLLLFIDVFFFLFYLIAMFHIWPKVIELSGCCTVCFLFLATV